MPPTCSYYYIYLPTYGDPAYWLQSGFWLLARGWGWGWGSGSVSQPRLIFLHTKQFEFTEISRGISSCCCCFWRLLLLKLLLGCCWCPCPSVGGRLLPFCCQQNCSELCCTLQQFAVCDHDVILEIAMLELAFECGFGCGGVAPNLSPACRQPALTQRPSYDFPAPPTDTIKSERSLGPIDKF